MTDRDPGPDFTYLDCAATAPVDEEILEKMLPYLRGVCGNPSALHGPGVRARAAIEEARERVARCFSPRVPRVVFTSGGTEGNNLAIRGYAAMRRGGTLVTSAIEHASAARAIDAAAKECGKRVVRIPGSSDGTLDLGALADALDSDVSVVALVHTQNETGVVQPIAEAAALIRERSPNALLHVDAIQSFGRVPLDDLLPVADSVSLSGHKVHAPKGVGALLLFHNADPVPALAGGGQERGLRSGTENIAGIIAFSHAAERAVRTLSTHSDHCAELAARIRRTILAIKGAQILGAEAKRRSPAVTAAAFPGLRGEILQHELERQGVVVGTGSACHAAKGNIPAAFTSLGLDEDTARSVIRVSVTWMTKTDDVDRLAEALPRAVARLREMVA